MKFVLPRVIKANRGDLASRWALLNSLSKTGVNECFVFSQFKEEIPHHIVDFIPYGPLRNIFPTLKGWKALLKSDVLIWGVGLDIQDDSSLMKLIYLWAIFRLYRLLGLEIWNLFQGAGPIISPQGRFLTRQILKQITVFVARDPQSLDLIRSLSTKPKTYLGRDAIFLSGIENNPDKINKVEKKWLDTLYINGLLTVGFNIRQWFHFSSSILPYQFSKKQYLSRSESKMEELLDAARQTVRFLRTKYNIRVLLLSAYQPDIVPWEDDTPWLQSIKNNFKDDDNVILVDQAISLPAYYQLMSRLDLVIGMRLHTTLIALRLGVPSINLSYTLKGEAILNHLELSEYAVNLEKFIATPDILKSKIAFLLENSLSERKRIEKAVENAIEENEALLKKILTK
ncbi:MAG: hypothetical protein HN392_01185 [Anaerolineae bacterium]|jgi:polysaccharide pyruvyl transferase WcaK-like protein|nr:hypothetical protein [Anaerolineae bacterium]MBT7075628.1 hypothetical protein [Anaerolineae bacterium]MBT7783780.1 hypothetical protein [Anaerolineae bacterium]